MANAKNVAVTCLPSGFYFIQELIVTKIQHIIQTIYPQEISGIVLALCTGDKSQISQEEKLFLEYLEKKKLVLAISDDPNIGYKIPKEDTITVGRMPNPYKYYLFEDVDLLAMNTLEQKVGGILDKQNKVLWWFRNRASKSWYSIQGWHEYKIRPDFVAAKKRDKSGLELVYIIESKGEHLSGNPDTLYKKAVLDIMTEQKAHNKIALYQQQELPLNSKINDHVEFYLIEEGNEEESLKKIYK